MRVIGQNIVFKALPNEEVEADSKPTFKYTESDKKEMKFHKGEVIDVGSDISFMEKGDVFYYDENRAYQTVVSGETVSITQAAFVILVLDSDD